MGEGDEGQKTMITANETNHVLEYRRRTAGAWTCWMRASVIDELARPAIKLALVGRLTDAIELAYDAWLKHYGNCHDVEFRVVTTMTTVTLLGGEWTEERLRSRA